MGLRVTLTIDARYRKIQVQPDEVHELLIKPGVKAIPRQSAEIVLDFDSTDDALHRSQEGAFHTRRPKRNRDQRLLAAHDLGVLSHANI